MKLNPLTELRNVPFGTPLKIGRHEGPLRHWRSEAIPKRIDQSIVDGPVPAEYVVRFEVLLGEDLFFVYEGKTFEPLDK